MKMKSRNNLPIEMWCKLEKENRVVYITLEKANKPDVEYYITVEQCVNEELDYYDRSTFYTGDEEYGPSAREKYSRQITYWLKAGYNMIDAKED